MTLKKSDVDFSKPLEDLEGNPVEFHRDYVTRFDGGKINTGLAQFETVFLEPSEKDWGWRESKAFLRNAVQIGDEYTCGSYEGEVAFIGASSFIIRTGQGAVYEIQKDTLEDGTGDVWTRLDSKVERFFNVYPKSCAVGGACEDLEQADRRLLDYGGARSGVIKITQSPTGELLDVSIVDRGDAA